MPGSRDSIHAHLQTWRPYTTSYGVLIAITGYLLVVGNDITVSRLTALAAAVVMVWIGGHYLADYCDRELDARSKPQRPIPSGRLTERAALSCGLAGFIGFTVLAGVLNGWSLIPAALCMISMVAYMWKLKACGIWGNLVRGAVTGFLMLFGAAVGAADSARLPGDLMLFALAFALHDCSSNIVGTLRDIRGDDAGRCATLAVRSGARVATLWAAGLYPVALTVIVTASLLRPSHSWTTMVFQIAAAALGTAAFSTIFRAPTPLPPASALKAHEILVVERVVITGSLICLTAGTVTAILVLLPALAITVWTQAVMRRSHELPDPDRTTAG